MTPAKRSSRGIAYLCAVALTLVTTCLLACASALAETPITSYTAVPSTTQAGGHPDVEIQFSVLNRRQQGSTSACNCEDAKDAAVHLPPGFIGDPHATPQCTIAEFSSDTCPIDSQVGMVNVTTTGGGYFNAAVYNLLPPPDVAGLLGFKVILYDAPQFTILKARTDGDYGLDATATSIYHYLPLESLQQVLWGVPADPSHDLLRLDPRFNPNVPGTSYYFDKFCDASGAESTTDPRTIVKPCGYSIPASPSNSPRTPFLQNPTNCDAPLGSSLDVLSYDGGLTHADSGWPQMTGCDQLSFNPSLYAQPTTDEGDSASGIDVNLTIPQQQSPSLPSPTELKGATVTLPAGFSINPSAADGKTACADTEAAFGTLGPAQCPEFAKVGSLEIDSSALPGPLPGFVYIGQPLPGNRYRIFLVADGFATHIKLAGTVTPDPQTGQLVITFENLPQSPLTAFNMHFFGSERGLLATPTHCGTYPVTSTFTPWDSSIGARTSAQFFTIDTGPGGSPCPSEQRPFAPDFQAATAGNTAGSHSPFSIDLIRPDGDQNLSALTVMTPPGFSATLAGVPYCPDAALAAAAASSYSGLQEMATPSCPLASQIGTATVGAGAGTHPVYVSGRVYLAGPYKGAPLSLAVITPAVSGPYDLGNVVVRSALKIDSTTAQITAVSDSFPLILEGIPLRLRSVRLNLDRPNFTLNPTNCDPSAITARIAGDQGAVATRESYFQVSNCAALPYGPKLSLKVTGGLNRLGNPAIHSTFTAGPGESNTSFVAVTLPKGELLDNDHVGNVCTRPAFAAGTCPPDSVIGTAEAITPLLEKPLKGNVYLRSNPSRSLPDLVADLKGQVDFELSGEVGSVKSGALRTTFKTVPDVPVTAFYLNLFGGSKGLLENSSPLCGKTRRIAVKTIGQNGAVHSTSPRLQTSCGGNARHKRHRRHTRGEG